MGCVGWQVAGRVGWETHPSLPCKKIICISFSWIKKKTAQLNNSGKRNHTIHLREPPLLQRAGSDATGLYFLSCITTAWFSPAPILCCSTNSGFDLELIAMVKSAVKIPVIASSGAGHVAHFSEVFWEANADAALAAGIFHRNEVAIEEVKDHLLKEGFTVRKER